MGGVNLPGCVRLEKPILKTLIQEYQEIRFFEKILQVLFAMVQTGE